MFIPLGTDRPLRRPTLVTYALLALNTLVFFAQQFLLAQKPEAYASLVAHLGASRLDFQWWQLFTSAFIHFGWMHFLGNSLFLWVFGPNIEDRLGRTGYLAFYLLGAAAAAGLHMATSQGRVGGASGAIAALTGAYLVLFPRTSIKVFSLLFVVGFTVVPAWWFIGLSIVWDIASQIAGRGNIAHAAHLGGYIFGATTAFALLWLKLLPRETYDLFADARQAFRRREIRQAARAFEQAKAEKLSPQVAKTLSPAEQQQQDDLVLKRAEVSKLVAAQDWEKAAPAYRVLADTYGHLPRAAALNRNQQYALANALYARQELPAAVYAYDRFLEVYPRDGESPRVRLLLGRLLARQLNDPVRAKSLLLEAAGQLIDPDEIQQARQLIAELG